MSEAQKFEDVPGFEVTEQICDCGNEHVMKGWRVGLMCAQARILDPEFWAELEPRPDQIEGETGVTRAQVMAEMREWKWG